MTQLHKKFTDEQVKDLMKRYLNKEVERKHIQSILGIGKTQFFALVKEYRLDPDNFSVQYERAKPTRIIAPEIKASIIKELESTKKFIDNKNIPIKTYNYSFIKNDLNTRYHQKVSLPTIINIAKQYEFYINEPKRHKTHDREVITNHIGELIQHDTSYHLWSPYAKEKWYLITSLDDFSRFLLYALLVSKESAWAHIRALQTVFLRFGLPLNFYVDSHSIFRFVRGRDELHYKHNKLTDEAIPQWKQTCQDCKVNVIHALSPQAKGKIERPYRWIQDHVVRICARDNISFIAQANRILYREVYEYNHKRIHSTTGEIPYLRYQRAISEKKNLFRQFVVSPPYQSIKDIFCFRIDRVVDAYRTISINNLKLKFNNAPIHEKVNLRIYQSNHSNLSEIRFWHKGKLLDIQKIKTSLLPSVHF